MIALTNYPLPLEFAGLHAGGVVDPDSDCRVAMMALIAICSNMLVGFGARSAKTEFGLFLVLPLVVSIAFFLIADIDSPRQGVIRVIPQNLLSLAQSLRTP